MVSSPPEQIATWLYNYDYAHARERTSDQIRRIVFRSVMSTKRIAIFLRGDKSFADEYYPTWSTPNRSGDL